MRRRRRRDAGDRARRDPRGGRDRGSTRARARTPRTPARGEPEATLGVTKPRRGASVDGGHASRCGRDDATKLSSRLQIASAHHHTVRAIDQRAGRRRVYLFESVSDRLNAAAARLRVSLVPHSSPPPAASPRLFHPAKKKTPREAASVRLRPCGRSSRPAAASHRRFRRRPIPSTRRSLRFVASRVTSWRVPSRRLG